MFTAWCHNIILFFIIITDGFLILDRKCSLCPPCAFLCPPYKVVGNRVGGSTDLATCTFIYVLVLVIVVVLFFTKSRDGGLIDPIGINITFVQLYFYLCICTCDCVCTYVYTCTCACDCICTFICVLKEAQPIHLAPISYIFMASMVKDNKDNKPLVGTFFTNSSSILSFMNLKREF